MKKFMDEVHAPTRWEWQRCQSGEGMSREGIKACQLIKNEQNFVDSHMENKEKFKTTMRQDFELSFQRISQVMDVCQACQQLIGGKNKYRNKQHIQELPCQRLREEITEFLGRKWNSEVFGKNESDEEEQKKV